MKDSLKESNKTLTESIEKLQRQMGSGSGSTQKADETKTAAKARGIVEHVLRHVNNIKQVFSGKTTYDALELAVHDSLTKAEIITGLEGEGFTYTALEKRDPKKTFARAVLQHCWEKASE